MDTADSTEIVPCRNTRCGQQLRIPAGEVLQVTCPTCGMSFTYRPLRTPGERNKGLSPEFQRKAWVMAELMLMIARESMTLLKRNNPAVATKVSQKQEWEAFIEFLKVLFNLADRVGAFYVPVSEYLQFLDALEDAVIDQMNNAFRHRHHVRQFQHRRDEGPDGIRRRHLPIRHRAILIRSSPFVTQGFH